ncbi:diphosphomevalonate decarboxylase [Sulfolobales archaeon HS-7]|nr:diphosphomevalonate decarboxylase [Sulfolobales archaeon HS-7]
MKSIKVSSPSNIALIKYWGKRDEKLNLPLNSSVSITLGEEMSVISELKFYEGKGNDRIVVNGRELEETEVGDYAGRVMNKIRELYGNVFLEAVSYTNFPVGAGLASSAAGIAGIVVGANEALHLNLSKREMSILSRIGSGSACRSVFGGIVIWYRGNSGEGSDSYCEQLFPPEHWPLKVIVGIVKESRKPISSRNAMLRVNTSQLLHCRLKTIEDDVMKLVETIKSRDKANFYRIVMKHSNNMHAVILDSWPPVLYLNEISFEIMQWVLENGDMAYTFDAGPNPYIICESDSVNKVVNFLSNIGAKPIVTGVGSGPKILE